MNTNEIMVNIQLLCAARMVAFFASQSYWHEMNMTFQLELPENIWKIPSHSTISQRSYEWFMKNSNSTKRMFFQVQKSQGQPPFGCIPNPIKYWDKLSTSTGFHARFLNHQQYVNIPPSPICQTSPFNPSMSANFSDSANSRKFQKFGLRKRSRTFSLKGLGMRKSVGVKKRNRKIRWCCMGVCLMCDLWHLEGLLNVWSNILWDF